MVWTWIMLAFVPVSILCYFLHVPPSAMFVLSCLAILPLAGLMGTATEELAKYRGNAVGGLLNATFGNATELIIAVVAIQHGQTDVVKASLVGSIIGNLLLVLGLSAFLGGLRFKQQFFNRNMADTHGAMMTMAVIALMVPALFVANVRGGIRDIDPRVQALSLGVASLLIILYLSSLVFSLYTHSSFLRDGEEHETEAPRWRQSKALWLLVLATVLIAIESEFLVNSIEPVVSAWHLSKRFLGVIIIPIIGNAAEHSTAVLMALRNKMDISLNIAISSATQIALFVAPVVVLVSHFSHTPLSMVVTNVELIAVAVAVVITGQVTRDGKTNWLEGAQLVAVYLVIAMAFYFIPEVR